MEIAALTRENYMGTSDNRLGYDPIRYAEANLLFDACVRGDAADKNRGQTGRTPISD